MAHYVMRGSRRSRTRSPSRLMASTVSKMAMPGKVESHQATLTASLTLAASLSLTLPLTLFLTAFPLRGGLSLLSLSEARRSG